MNPATTVAPDPAHRPDLKTLVREWEFWSLVGIVILFFHRELFFSETVFFRDLCSYFLPQKQLLADQLRSACLPLWNPFIQGGQAFLPSLANGLLLPSNLLYLVLPPVRALNIVIALHMMLALASTYALARVLGLRPAAAAVSGLAFGFSGPVLSLVNLLNHFLALSLLPLMTLFWHLFLSEHRNRWLKLGVVVGAFQVFAASPEINVISLLFLLGWTLAFPSKTITPGRRSALWAVLAILILGVSAVQLLPTAEIAANSPRGFGIDHDNLTRWSLHPKRTLEITLPALLGHVDSLDQNAYWGRALVDSDFPFLISIYLGCTVLLLGIPAAISRGAPLPRRFRTFLTVTMIGFAILACGRHIGLVDLILRHLPLVQLFRYPSKFLAGSVLPLALLAGSGLQLLFSHTKMEGAQPLRSVIAAGGAAAALLAGLWLVLTTSESGGLAVTQWLFGGGAGDHATAGVGNAVLHACTFALLFVALLVSQRRVSGQWVYRLAAIIVLADLVSAGIRVVPSAPDALVTEPVETQALITENIGNGRLYRTEIPSDVRIRAPSDHVAWKFRWVLELYAGWWPTTAGIPRIFDRDLMQLSPLPLMRLKHALPELDWERRAAVLGAAGVTLVLTEEAVDTPRLERIAAYPNRSDLSYALYRNLTAVPPVRLAATWRSFASEDEIAIAMTSLDYDPRKAVLILGDTRGAHVGAPAQGGSSIRCIRDEAREAEYEVAAAEPGYLVFAQPFYPGWKVEIDGRPTPIVRADFAFSAVFLEAGRHVVRRSYLPRSLLIGALISALFAGALIPKYSPGSGCNPRGTAPNGDSSPPSAQHTAKYASALGDEKSPPVTAPRGFRCEPW